MNILMMTNTYTPLVGGLERSVKSFTEEYRARGHRVVVVAPTFKGMPRRERDVIRVPAIQNFNGTDFSVRLLIPGLLAKRLKKFRPDIVHAHHPFLLGDTALRAAITHQVPLIFTHHTLFEQYTHYLPMNPDRAGRFLMELARSYANLCDQVFAPSESVAALLRKRRVLTPIEVVPTGIPMAYFRAGSRARFRKTVHIPEGAFLVGHLGRLAPEKNLRFLTRAVVSFLKREPRARFVVIGQGPSEPMIKRVCERAGVGERVYFPGVLKGRSLLEAYRAMDVFAFASKSETQGLVLTEAMAAGVPVVAVDAPGVREVVHDGQNGRLLPSEDVRQFAAALRWISQRSAVEKQKMRQAARETAEVFSMPRCADRALALYTSMLVQKSWTRKRDESLWAGAMRRIQSEWDLLKKSAKATRAMMMEAGAHR